MARWETLLKKHSYSEHRKSRPSGSVLPAAPSPLPPSASASLEAGRPSPPPSPPSSLLSEGRGWSGGSKGVSRVGSRDVSPPPSRKSWLLGASVTQLLLPSRGLE